MAAAVVVGTAAAATTAHVTARYATTGWSGSLVVLTVAALVGAAGYTAAARLLRLSELRDVAAATLAVLRTS
jgi:putative peptidoglycan lipid II flippase